MENKQIANHIRNIIKTGDIEKGVERLNDLANGLDPGETIAQWVTSADGNLPPGVSIVADVRAINPRTHGVIYDGPNGRQPRSQEITQAYMDRIDQSGIHYTPTFIMRRR